MAVDPPNPVNRKGQISADALRRASDLAYGSSESRGAGGIGGFSSGESFQFSDNGPKETWLLLTAFANGAYEWIEQMDDGEGGMSNLPASFEGTENDVPAYEVNGVATVPANGTVIVRAVPSDDGQSFLFADPTGSSGTGNRKVRGTLTGNLTFGGNTTMNVAGGGSLTVFDWLLSSGQSVANGTQVTAFQDDDGDWYVDGAQCP